MTRWRNLFGKQKGSDLDDKAFALAENEKKNKAERATALEAKINELDVSEANILRAQLETLPAHNSFLKMYRYATAWDLFLIGIGLSMAVLHGAGMPMFTIVLGGLSNNFNGFVVGTTASRHEFLHQVDHTTLYYVYIGIALFATSAIQSYLLNSRGEILASRFRKEFMKAIISQNIAYFDNVGAGQVTTQLINDTMSIQNAVGEKSGIFLAAVASVVSCLIISLVQAWKLSLILSTAIVFLFITLTALLSYLFEYANKASAVYTAGASVAEEALSSIRTTVAFSSQTKLLKKFDIFLKRHNFWHNRLNLCLGIVMGIFWAMNFFIYALSYWEGSRLLVRGEIDIGKLIAVTSSMTMGTMELGTITPMMQHFSKGIAASNSLNKTIERVPIVNSMGKTGRVLPEVTGSIEFSQIKFRYPSRPDVTVLENFNLKIHAGQTVALVGTSGSGKSTLISLLERFYVPLSGTVTLDGVSIDELDVQWLRKQIGYVSQEPILFAESVYQNVLYGLHSADEMTEEQKLDMVKSALMQANAWDFVSLLPDGIHTNVGEKGALLSGGQKQRVAIARAIVSNPKILLLDEATSALDTVSEGVVQDALDKAAENRTTVVIAHRLSTVRDADNIVVMTDGKIVEQGNHNYLLDLNGTYAKLVELQQINNDISIKEQLPEDSVVDEKQALISISNSDPIRDLDALSIVSIGEKARRAGTSKSDITPTNWELAKMIFELNRKHWKLSAFTLFLAIIQGYGYPALSLVMGKTSEAMMVPPAQYPEMRSSVNLYSGMFFLEGCVLLFSTGFASYFFGVVTDSLQRTVRKRLLQQYMRMDLSFFDNDENSAGSLTTSLATEGKAIEGIGGATLGSLMQSIVMVVAGVITSLVVNWRIGLVGCACMPILVACGFARYYVMYRIDLRNEEVYKKSGSLAAQYTTAIRTVQSLTREKEVVGTYYSLIETQVRSSLLPYAYASAAYGLSQGFSPLVLALMSWFASRQLANGNMTIFAFYVVLEASIFASTTAGALFTYAPDMAKAKRAAIYIHQMLTTIPNIDVESNDGKNLGDRIQGDIEFHDVTFRYPSRPNIPVLRGLDLSIKKGQYVAFVGPSGSGKSTTIGLIERFYDPLSGKVSLDGVDLKSINLTSLRSHMSLVQQEPALYAGTIRENILLGWNNSDESQVSDAMIEDVCKKANIHDFIVSLPDGYNTLVGAHGTLLSGGQKQRVAIARALIRDPAVLLLDEATSALDSESERVVQKAIDEAARGRTTIAIAHRLATVKNADIIYVLEKGVVVESGSHDELIVMGGLYSELAKLQNLAST